jgi:pilus assembly protein TadC
MIRIPFCLVPVPLLEKNHSLFLGAGTFLENTMFPNFNLKLQQARMNITAKKYLAMCFMNDIFIALSSFAITYFFASNFGKTQQISIFAGLVIAFILFSFALLQQRGMPEIYIKKRIDEIDQNILPALQNILIQLRSGIPLFDVLVNVASTDYGEVSKEFTTVVRKINGGIPQIDALERVALENPSNTFRSAIWQMVNGMKTGTNLGDILREIMEALSEEQLLQVEEYGANLSPLTMFYMMMAVIIPAIGVNFLIVIVAFMGLDLPATKAIFWGVYGFNLFVQIMFINVIKSKRPALLKT